jgi:hypothetical protein
MMFDIKQVGIQMAAHMIVELKSDKLKVKALAVSEAKHLASSFARIAELHGSGQINSEEATILVQVQRHASESKLASLAEIKRISAQRAVGIGLKSVIGLIDGVIGVPLIAWALRP